MTVFMKDFKPTEANLSNLYFKEKIDKIKYWHVNNYGYKKGSIKHMTTSEFVKLKERNERYLILYQHEIKKNYCD
jgi:hypothetical protein